MRRNGILCGLGGVAAIALLLLFMGFGSVTVEAQVANPTSPYALPQNIPVRPDSGYGQSPQPTMRPTPPATVQAATPPAEASPAKDSVTAAAGPGSSDVPPTGQSLPPAGITTYTTPATVLSAASESFKGEGIDALLTRLKSVKAQKAELERTEQELMVLLREKIREQKQQLQTLGIMEEATSPRGGAYIPR